MAALHKIYSLSSSQHLSCQVSNQNDEAKVNLARTYKAKVEAELTDLCDTVLNLLNEYLIPNASESESKVFIQ